MSEVTRPLHRLRMYLSVSTGDGARLLFSNRLLISSVEQARGIGNVFRIPCTSGESQTIAHSVGCLAVAVSPCIDEDLFYSYPGRFGKQRPAANSISGVPYDGFGRGNAVAFSPGLLVVDTFASLHECGFPQNNTTHMPEDLFLAKQIQLIAW